MLAGLYIFSAKRCELEREKELECYWGTGGASVNLLPFLPNLELGELLRKRASDSRFLNKFHAHKSANKCEYAQSWKLKRILRRKKAKRDRAQRYAWSEKDINFWWSRIVASSIAAECHPAATNHLRRFAAPAVCVIISARFKGLCCCFGLRELPPLGFMGLDCGRRYLAKEANTLGNLTLSPFRVRVSMSALFGNLDALFCVCYYFQQLAYKSSIFLFFTIQAACKPVCGVFLRGAVGIQENCHAQLCKFSPREMGK